MENGATPMREAQAPVLATWASSTENSPLGGALLLRRLHRGLRLFERVVVLLFCLEGAGNVVAELRHGALPFTGSGASPRPLEHHDTTEGKPCQQ